VTSASQTTAEMVEQIGPVLEKYASQAEAERRLAPEAMTAMVDAGVMRTLIPRGYGGLETEPVAAFKMFEDIAAIDSAAGWIAGNCCGISTMGMMYSAEANSEKYSDPRLVVAGAWFPPGLAEPVQGGYRVTGRWSFGSGVHYATWLTCQALITENGAPRIGENGQPSPLIMFFPAREATIHDNWDVLGMRGTGSHDFEVNDLFIPERHAWQPAPISPTDPAFQRPLYRLGFWPVAPVNASVALGIARAALRDLISLAGVKTPSYTQTSLADRPVVQDRIARARALIDAGSSYIQTAVANAVDFVQDGRKCDIEHGMALALAGSFGHEAAAQAVDLIHSCAGTSAVRSSQPFQQHFRDVHTVSQHAFSTPSRFESVGKLMLGKESDWVFYYL